ncbi:DUF1549 domain-containing protein [Anatilimnocola sp. NA78]|uniref:DUF1549 domain-containing protein n=1 Tax=Anatilimnocola sp. NA78 TaxID=3415683 RepID=UPI003CE4F72C
MSCYRAWIAVALLAGCCQLVSAAEEPSQVAAKADELLAGEMGLGNKSKPVPLADDEIFLRRVTLDVQGRLPTTAEITTFALDPASDKRAVVVRKLLADPRYGENWSKYWRDVIMYRATEQRAQLIAGVLTEYLRDSLNQNKPWSTVATEFITASGDGLTQGETALIIAQEGKPEETVSEISRIFLGVQIQCAQCHDHPTDRWKREQFHELAAFFPRVSSRVILTPENRSITVAVAEFGEEPFERNGNRVRGSAEHRMSDLKNPDAKGRMMKPVLFATGDSVPVTTRDSDRRGQLAEFITKPENPYFAQALVNRLWSELVGEGFYEPVDDMGPDREGNAPRTLEHLSTAFASTGYDVKWLFETITSTQAYQRASRSRRNPEQVAFVANVPQRLRADQLFDNALAALGAREPAGMAGPAYGPGARFGRGPRQQFATVFGYDPSERRDEVAGTIPQALVMMNSSYFNGLLDGRSSRTALGKLLTEIKDDRALISELYLRTLAREPSSKEVDTCLAHVAAIQNRTEAFEDISWSLLNSTEFLYRR